MMAIGKPGAHPEELLTVKDIAPPTKISEFTWRDMLKRGVVPSLRIGRLIRVKRSDFEAFLRDCERHPKK
jgi:excisionase family DNA binding protein